MCILTNLLQRKFPVVILHFGNRCIADPRNLLDKGQRLFHKTTLQSTGRRCVGYNNHRLAVVFFSDTANRFKDARVHFHYRFTAGTHRVAKVVHKHVKGLRMGVLDAVKVYPFPLPCKDFTQGLIGYNR